MLFLRPFWDLMNKTTLFSILTVCLLSSCAAQKVCPAYHSAFILDDREQQKAYGLFTEVDGVYVPKRPYGFKFKADKGDSMMNKFIEGTKGRGFRVQKGRIHPFEKYGFDYENRLRTNLFAKIFTAREKPVLENPYLFDKIFKKRPYYQFDVQEKEITHFNSKYYDSITAQRVDTTRYRELMERYDSLPPPIQAQFAPLLRGGFNREQEVYNQRYVGYFLRIKETQSRASDSLSLQEMLADTVAVDTAATKKGLLGGFGLFKKKNKPKKNKPKKAKRSNSEANKEEENN
jgi:hypothetical protein